MLNESLARRLAYLHHESEKEKRQFSAISQSHPSLTIDDAYRIQQAWVDIKRSEGRHITGRKIGLTSRAMQDAMKINEPDFGTFLDDMEFRSGVTLKASDYNDPRIEVELAFILNAPLVGENLTIDKVLAVTERIVPAIELIDARSFRVDPETGYARTVIDTIADNAANAGYILSDQTVPLDEDLAWVGAVLKRNDVVEETGLAAGVLGHPAEGIIWLARRFAAQDIALEPGHIYLAGSFTRPVLARAGDRFHADFGPHGHITLNFS